jgi:hypothetical protein
MVAAGQVLHARLPGHGHGRQLKGDSNLLCATPEQVSGPGRFLPYITLCSGRIPDHTPSSGLRADSAFSVAVDPNRTTEMTIAAIDRDIQASE